jgi:hypothetical protein
LEKQAREDSRYSEALLVRLGPFLRKEVVEKEAVEKVAGEKEATDNPMARVIFIMSYFYF